MNKNFNIKKFLDLSGYDTDIRKARRKNNTEDKNTAEFFTPYPIIKKMCDNISDEDWADPEKTFCEPCAGNGQFVIYIIWNRLMHGISLEQTLKTIYAVELMEDNCKEMKQRILDLLDGMEIEYDKAKIKRIINKQIVCHDFFTWNFEEWREYTQAELDLMKKPKKIYNDGLTQEALF